MCAAARHCRAFYFYWPALVEVEVEQEQELAAGAVEEVERERLERERGGWNTEYRARSQESREPLGAGSPRATGTGAGVMGVMTSDIAHRTYPRQVGLPSSLDSIAVSRAAVNALVPGWLVAPEHLVASS